jgi:hypothetical protein
LPEAVNVVVVVVLVAFISSWLIVVYSCVSA